MSRRSGTSGPHGQNTVPLGDVVAKPVPADPLPVDVCTGALLGTGPLAESVVAGVVDVLADGDVDGEGLDDFVEDADGEALDDLDGDEEGLCVGDFDGDADDDFEGLLVPVRVPLGSPDGFRLAVAVGVGSSEVPYVPSGPGSVGVATAPGEESSPFFGVSAPRLSS
jgi:hypothetical protein